MCFGLSLGEGLRANIVAMAECLAKMAGGRVLSGLAAPRQARREAEDAAIAEAKATGGPYGSRHLRRIARAMEARARREAEE